MTEVGTVEYATSHTLTARVSPTNTFVKAGKMIANVEHRES
jgi:hypothetical protein